MCYLEALDHLCIRKMEVSAAFAKKRRREETGTTHLQERGVLELAHHVDFHAEEWGDEAGEELAVGVVEGEEGVPALLWPVLGSVDSLRIIWHFQVAHVDGLHDVGDQVGVGDHHAFGEAGRAGGVVDCCDCLARLLGG